MVLGYQLVWKSSKKICFLSGCFIQLPMQTSAEQTLLLPSSADFRLFVLAGCVCVCVPAAVLVAAAAVASFSEAHRHHHHHHHNLISVSNLVHRFGGLASEHLLLDFSPRASLHPHACAFTSSLCWRPNNVLRRIEIVQRATANPQSPSHHKCLIYI